jgi:hypothetical protein
MALPWLLGAAAVATVGFLASGDDDYDDDEEYDREQRIKKEKKRKRKEAKNNFHEKWGVKHNVKSIDAPKIQKLIKQEEKLKKESEKLEALGLEMKSL